MAVAVYKLSPRSAPTSAAIAVYSFFGKNVNKITAGLVYDNTSDEFQSKAATWSMAVRCGVDVVTIVTAFRAMSPELEIMPAVGARHIKNLRPLKPFGSKERSPRELMRKLPKPPRCRHFDQNGSADLRQGMTKQVSKLPVSTIAGRSTIPSGATRPHSSPGHNWSTFTPHLK
ncbi:hypothetical protein CTA2_10191 [Colletotrichum tanaceti]|uniref:Uncharacterized protein n=1 Tax=Colletotrichum tanaceti TaxID=1306861 RepID=A0A4U6WZG7_9PEZI|nr:hypothetical protein CTA2_10191 [Colletotrichum tanaceti]TKW48531.1 hypothetical protein CTA1_10682 [Colletotrichum tanaceti]